MTWFALCRIFNRNQPKSWPLEHLAAIQANYLLYSGQYPAHGQIRDKEKGGRKSSVHKAVFKAFDVLPKLRFVADYWSVTDGRTIKGIDWSTFFDKVDPVTDWACKDLEVRYEPQRRNVWPLLKDLEVSTELLGVMIARKNTATAVSSLKGQPALVRDMRHVSSREWPIPTMLKPEITKVHGSSSAMGEHPSSIRPRVNMIQKTKATRAKGENNPPGKRGRPPKNQFSPVYATPASNKTASSVGDFITPTSKKTSLTSQSAGVSSKKRTARELDLFEFAEISANKRPTANTAHHKALIRAPSSPLKATKQTGVPGSEAGQKCPVIVDLTGLSGSD
jgi:hypothetical protein